ncbi:YhgE/Pip family protein [Sanguibacter sp. HDW7]|uniref:YhgE/Pip family protein n=1 Tax=Sanguibacter sp. HDW7 TaxID=2714931 RepID=UPI00140B8C55|nr:YhgE/Pip family protein [Sanguibacter sp. HDW7]QIK82307.1 hypothetical protein G7063_00770 [Sanguibacter sp. HDW7]
MTRSTQRRWLLALVALLVPVALVATMLASQWDPASRASDITAAVVNHDEPVTIDGQLTPLGRQLAAELVKGSRSRGGWTWVVTDADDASTGLEAGTYAAVVTIPETFSADATSFADGDGARQARIDVASAQGSTATRDLVTTALADAATVGLGRQLTRSFVEQVLVGFSTTGDQLGQAADGAHQLADGAGKLADGQQQLADGADTLASGTGTLADGLGTLATGAGSAATGATTLATGAGTLATGAKDLASGARDLAAGTKPLATGATQSSDGAKDLAKGAKDLAGGAKALATGTTGIAEGATALADGAKPLAEGADAVADGVESVLAGVRAMQPGVAKLPGSVAALRAALDQLDDVTSQLTTVRAQMGAAGCAADRSAPGCPELLGAELELEAAYGQLLDGLEGGLAALEGDPTADPKDASAGLHGLVAGLGALVGDPKADPTDPTAGLHGLAAGARGVADGADALSSGATALATGANDLATGASALADGTSSLSSGATSLSGGLSKLAAGTTTLSQGAGTLASGAGKLSSGTAGLAGGAKDLASGVGQLSEGARGASDGAVALRDGASTLADGLGQTLPGTTQLTSGARDLASGLGTAVDELAKQKVADPTSLADVVVQPVASPAARELGPIGAVGVTMAVALWLGTLVLTMRPRISGAATLGTTRSSFQVTARGIGVTSAVAAVQGALAGVVVALVTEAPWVVVPAAALVAVVLLWFLHAVVAWAGNVGRAFALVVGVAVLVASASPSAPAWVGSLGQLGPLDAASRFLGGLSHEGAAGGALVVLLVWAGVSAAAAVGATTWHRRQAGQALLATT